MASPLTVVRVEEKLSTLRVRNEFNVLVRATEAQQVVRVIHVEVLSDVVKDKRRVVLQGGQCKGSNNSQSVTRCSARDDSLRARRGLTLNLNALRRACGGVSFVPSGGSTSLWTCTFRPHPTHIDGHI